MSNRGRPPAKPTDSSRDTVLVVNDEELICRGILAVIAEAPGLRACGYAKDESTAVQMLENYRPAVLILDLVLGHRDGIHFLKDIAGRFPELRIIALTQSHNQLHTTRALDAGAAAWATKQTSAAELVDCIRSALAAKKPGPNRHRKTAESQIKRKGAHLLALTDRELHVFQLIGEGLRTGRIAKELGLSRKTIECYREHIKLKLGYANAEALVQGALEWVHHTAPSLRTQREK